MKHVSEGSRLLPFVFFCFLLGLLPEKFSYALNLVPETSVSRIQEAIIRDVAQGIDVRQRVQDYVKKYSSSSKSPALSRSISSAKLELHLKTLRNILTSITKQGGLSQQNYTQLLNAYSVLQTSNIMLLDKLSRIETQLTELGVSSILKQRRLDEQNRYKNLIEGLFNELSYIEDEIRSTDDINKLFSGSTFIESLLGDFVSKANKRITTALNILQQNIRTIKPKILRANTLPYRQLGIATRNPVIAPTITPAYSNTSGITSNAEDLAASAAAPLSAEILEKAKALNNDYIKIYDFVRSEIKTEWYAGSMKGAAGTLRQLAGNDVDQASLLIALFRASGLPSRYVQGVVELPIEVIMETLGLTDENQAVKVLNKSGVAYSPQIRGGRIAAVHVEQVWVEAYMPYSNYRGAIIDKTGSSWLPLMPGIKNYAITASTHILESMVVNSDVEINNYLSEVQDTDYLSSLRLKVNNYLQANNILTNYEQQLGVINTQIDNLGLIPHTLPVKVIAVTSEFASLPVTLRHQVRFVLHNADKDNAAIVLDYSVPVAEIASERITLSYIPATVDDQRVVNKFGGLDNVPAYLVKLRPQIKINGRQTAIASDSISMGINHRFEIYLKGPHGSERIDQDVVSGGYHAIAVNAQKYNAIISDDDPADTEYLGPKILSQLGHTYTKQWQEAEQELSGLHDVAIVRPLPSVTITSNVYHVDIVLGQPHQIKFEGISMDAALRVAEPVSRSGKTSDAKAWMQMSALQGSKLESQIFEELFGLQSISADKGLQLAVQEGINVQNINSSNSASVIPTLTHSAEVITDIENWIRLGLTVQVPTAEIKYNDWLGSVWRVEDPVSGAAGYFLSGGLAGGTTTTYPDDWRLFWLYWLMAGINSPPPNQDPLTVTSMSKSTGSDWQKGVAGEVLGDLLYVVLRDDAGQAVAGAQVTFKVTDGAGKFGEQESITVESDFNGIASVEYTLGQHTLTSPFYVLKNPDDKYATLAGLNSIDVSVPSYNGVITVDEPFFALAYPGEPVDLVREDPAPTATSFQPGRWVDVVIMKPVDQYGNAVSNTEVNFSMNGSGNNACTPSMSGGAGAVFNNNFSENGCPANPIFGECGSASYSTTSRSWGAPAGVMVGNVSLSTYTLNVSSAGASKQYSYKTAGTCSNSPQMSIGSTYMSGPKGQNINAARAGEQFQRPVKTTIFFGLPSVLNIKNGQVSWASDLNLTRVNASVSGFSVTNNGSASGANNVGTGTYQTNITTGFTPGINEVNIEFSNVIKQQYLGIMSDAIDSATNEDELRSAQGNMRSARNFLQVSRSWKTSEVFSVEANIAGVESQNVPEGIDASAIVLDENNRSLYNALINYNIVPSEYEAAYTILNFYEDGVKALSLNGNGESVSGYAKLYRSSIFNPDLPYEVDVVLNQGTKAEVRSDKVPLKIIQKLFKNVDRHISAYLDIDVLNQRSCEIGTEFNFTLNEAATVSLKLIDIEDQAEITLINAQQYAKGEQQLDISPINLLPGKYRFELSGISDVTGSTEVKHGSAVSELRTQDRLPVGQTLVKGVNVFNGSLALSSTEFSYPGRGPSLELTRSYSSKGGSTPGPMGVGWTHNYDSKIAINRCGDISVIGAQGGGMRFVPNAQGQLVPLKGYHGTLIKSTTDNTFDFYSKDGSKYHYRKYTGRDWNLAYIEDTNGNVTQFTYDPTSQKTAKLVMVEDAVGRQLKFVWKEKLFQGINKTNSTIIAVQGADGELLNYEYDNLGNMIRAARVEPNSSGGLNELRVNEYTYNADITAPFAQQHKVLSHTNAIGGVTTYSYNELEIDITKGTGGTIAGVSVLMPYGFVTEVKDPEGGITKFDYDDPHFATNTTVTDGRSNVTTYTMNTYGSPLTIVSPIRSLSDSRIDTTTMTWSSSDVLMTSRTDANGVKTTFDHDEHGNVMSETVERGLLNGNYTVSNTYKTFPNKPWIKNRLATRTNRNDFTTTYDYDNNGNLDYIRDAKGYEVRHGYDDFGDRRFTKDARGNSSLFTYDNWGNLETVTDPLQRTVRTLRDRRGRLLQLTEARKINNIRLKTKFDYNELNQLILKTNDLRDTRKFTYDPLGNKLTELDEEGRLTTWAYDLESRIETITKNVNLTLDYVMTYSYDAVGNKTREVDWRGNATTFDYDGRNQLVTMTEPLSKLSRFTYDAVGNVETETNPNTFVTAYDYDELNRRTLITDARNKTMRIEFDGVNKRKEIDQLNRETRYDYDEINRLITKTEPLGRIFTFDYDENSNKISETTPNGGERRFTYYDDNRLLKTYDTFGFVSTLFYDDNGNVIKENNRRLHETLHDYDNLNRRKITTDQDGFVTTFDYDKVGNVRRELLANGNSVIHGYDYMNRHTSSTDNIGLIARVEYDANGNRTLEVDGNNNQSIHHYNALNRLFQSDLPENRTVKVSYDDVGNKKTETDARNKTTLFDYDELNRLTLITDPNTFTVRNTYDDVGNKKTVKDKRNFVTLYDYDDVNRLTKVTDARSQVMTYIYNDQLNTKTETNNRGIVSVSKFDSENQLISITKDNLLISRLEYDEVGNTKFDHDAKGNIIGYIYNKRNLLSKESHLLAAISNYDYDNMGNRNYQRDPEGRITRSSYDQRNRVISVTNFANESMVYTYDANNNRITETNPKGSLGCINSPPTCATAAYTSHYNYDNADRLSTITDAEGGVTTYTYDLNSNKETQKDAKGYTTTYAYDDFNRQISTTYIDTANESYDYDANGNRILLIDAKGQSFTYGYDELNREDTRSYPAPTTGDDIISITTSYDANNNPEVITETYTGTSGTRTTTKTYDNFDRLDSVTDAFGKVIRYSYDANGNRETLTDPDAKVTRYTFDVLNRLEAVTAANATTTYGYDRSSLQTSVTYPNGTSVKTDYDNAMRTEQILNRQGLAIISQYNYSFDLNGNRKTQFETNGGTTETTTYTYDNNDRLKQVDYPDAIVNYTYDANFNRETEQTTDKVSSTVVVNKTFGYNNRNQLETITDNIDNAQNVVYQFDTNGNQTIKSKNGVTTTFVYDVRDKLLSVRENATTLGQYFYDYQGMRVAKTGGPQSTLGLVRYTYDDDSVLLQTNGAGATLAKYEYGPDRLLSLNHTTEGRQYYHFDALGSTVNLTKPDASIQARYQYDAWGNFRSETGTSFNKFAFTGHEKDTETNLYYFKARYYDPDTGRFLSQDPYLGEAGTPPSLHRYLYAYGNPTVYVDLDGYSAEDFRQLGQELYSDGNKIGAFGVAIAYSFYEFTDGLSLGTLEDSSVELQKDQNLSDAAKNFGAKQVTKAETYAEEVVKGGVIAGTAKVTADIACSRTRAACNAIGDFAKNVGNKLNTDVRDLGKKKDTKTNIESDSRPGTTTAQRNAKKSEKYGGEEQRSILAKQVKATRDRARGKSKIARENALKEAKGEVDGFHKMRKEGYDLQDLEIKNKSGHGLDQVYKHRKTGGYAINEAKHGKGLGKLVKSGGKGNKVRQGSQKYNRDRLEKYRDVSPENKAKTNELYRKMERGKVKSFASSFKGKTHHEIISKDPAPNFRDPSQILRIK